MGGEVACVLRLKKSRDVVIPSDATAAPDTEKNADAFAEMVQFLDDRSLSLVMRDANNKGKEALEILRQHYLGTGKPRIITLYTELTSLRKSTTETLTDYIIRAENAATSLRSSGETISDGLLTAMILKGLPVDYKSFSVFVTQKDKPPTFLEFKTQLRNFEETDKVLYGPDTGSTVMKAFHKQFPPKNKIKCYTCGTPGHKSNQCTKKKWCSICKNNTHTNKSCQMGKIKRTVPNPLQIIPLCW